MDLNSFYLEFTLVGRLDFQDLGSQVALASKTNRGWSPRLWREVAFLVQGSLSGLASETQLGTAPKVQEKQQELVIRRGG